MSMPKERVEWGRGRGRVREKFKVFKRTSGKEMDRTRMIKRSKARTIDWGVMTTGSTFFKGSGCILRSRLD